MTLSGSTVLVVGASSGIGLATAREAATHGASVIAASRSLERLEAVLGAAENVRLAAVDMVDAGSVAGLFEDIEPLDHLVVSASAGEPGSFTDRTPEQARSYLEGKFWGTYRLAWHAAQRMTETGSMTFVTGGLAARPTVGLADVTVAFAALEGLVRALAVELAPNRVNAIRPGLIDTEMWSGLEPEARQRRYDQSSSSVPSGRVGRPEEVAQAAVFLMQSTFVTGSVLEINGGQLLTPELQ